MRFAEKVVSLWCKRWGNSSPPNLQNLLNMFACNYTVEISHTSIGNAIFHSFGYNEKDAVSALVSYLVGQRVGEGRLWWKADGARENFSTHTIGGARCMYVDAILAGAPFPVYILCPKVRMADF